MAKLLISVRSRDEASAALAGGADIIDVKEPVNGSLGRAPFAVWRQVRQVVPSSIPMSVALGELGDGFGAQSVDTPPGAWAGVSFRKIGLAGAPPDWIERWSSLRRHSRELDSSDPAWVAVVYMDWQFARAPDPDAIIRAAGEIDDCRGVLFDTWDKSRCWGIDLTWKPLVDRVRDAGRFVALAGSLDVEAIGRLAPLAPDIFAVRGAACAGGDRLKTVDPQRVSVLARAAGSIPIGEDREILWQRT